MALRRARYACASVAALALAGCGGDDTAANGGGNGHAEVVETGLAAIQSRGELVVLTTPGPTTYEEGEDGAPAGYEVDLARAFAEDLGVEARFVVFDELSGVFEALEAGEGDIAAAGITRTQERAERFLYGPSYKNISEMVVTRRGGPDLDTPADLAGVDIAVVARSSYVETLQGLQEEIPGIEWEAVEAPSARPLMMRVQNEELASTVSDSNLVAHVRLGYPELLTPLNLTENDRSLAWLTGQANQDLVDAMETWFSRAHDEELLEELDERWYGHASQDFDYVDTRRFIRAIEQDLPRYEQWFKEAADEYGLDWRWLAAQGFQESHWDAGARSPTGVRGVMMLTLPTAGELGVTDRTDPRQSIFGGAQYMANLLGRIPEGVEGEERLFKAMAAYNVGMGHVYDARGIAEEQGLDKNSWPDVRRTLPLLSEPAYYEGTRYGYARGGEPVHYVRNIRRYKALLDLHLGD
ncbi:MAG: membrane-bound lytic murein transglycosylase MltF [Oceanicaulis sp.]